MKKDNVNELFWSIVKEAGLTGNEGRRSIHPEAGNKAKTTKTDLIKKLYPYL